MKFGRLGTVTKRRTVWVYITSYKSMKAVVPFQLTYSPLGQCLGYAAWFPD